MLTLILQTQEGLKIELNVQPEDTFADLKSQYPDNDGQSDSLAQLITNGANVPENTKIFDYVTDSAREWFSADNSMDVQDDSAADTATIETQIKKCCAQGSLNSDATTSGKPFFPLPTDHERLSMRLIEVGSSELHNEIVGLDGENAQKYFLCDNHFSDEALSLPLLSAAEQSAVSLLKPKNQRIWRDTKDAILSGENETYELEEVGSEREKNCVLELSDTVEDLEHPGILCRLCGEPTANPIHLYTRDEESEELSCADKINLCLPVTVTVTDPLPKQICEECQTKLNTCHELALSSLQTEDKLMLLLRQNKLCVNDTKDQQCPLCLEGDMQVVKKKKSGIYRKDDEKRSKAAESTWSEKIVSVDSNDPEQSGINFPLLAESLCKSAEPTNSSEDNNPDENFLSSLPKGEFPCSICSEKIDSASIRTHECSLESRESTYNCFICSDTNFAYPHELEVHYRRHGMYEGKFTCDLCGYECEILAEAEEHVKLCRPEFWEIRCEACDKTFPTAQLITDHQCYRMSFDPQVPEAKIAAKLPIKAPKCRKKQLVQYNCFFCQKEFSRKKYLKVHIAASHGEEMDTPTSSKCYKCRKCNEAFVREADAESHITLRHLGPLASCDFPAGQEFTPEELTISRLYVCEFCERCFTMPSSLHDHREIEHDDKRGEKSRTTTTTTTTMYTCTCCDSVFDSHRQLTNHMSGESHQKPFNILGVRLFYVCKYCDKMFLHYSSLSSHALRHKENEAPYLCRPCNMNFESYREIAAHRDIAHPYQSTIQHERSKRCYKCQYCQKQFSYEVALVKHIRIHTGEKPYKCSICGKGFAQSSGLNTHVKIHSDVRPYACPKCPRAFKIKGDCDNHVKRHSGNRPYKCEFCSKAFMTQHVFSQHRRIHTNDRPYKCDVCGEAFRRSHVLTVHRRIHTGEKPHVCDLCPKTYRQRGDLVKHRKVQHGVNSANLAKHAFPDKSSENSYDSLANTSGKIAHRTSAANSSLLLPL